MPEEQKQPPPPPSFYVVVARGENITGNVGTLGLAWRDGADRMSRLVDFRPSTEDRDFVGITDPKWLEEWTHALDVVGRTGEWLATWTPQGDFAVVDRYASRGGTVGDAFPALRGAIDIRPVLARETPASARRVDAAIAHGFLRGLLSDLDDTARWWLGLTKDDEPVDARTTVKKAKGEPAEVRRRYDARDVAVFVAEAAEGLVRERLLPAAVDDARSLVDSIKRGGV